MNAITIRNIVTGPLVDEFIKNFIGRAIYSMREFIFGL